jgi:cytochrome c-type biogenesis protein CcmH
MTAFAVIAVLVTLGVLGLLVLPLLRKSEQEKSVSANELSMKVLRDQLADLEQQHALGQIDEKVYIEEKAELERRALEDGVVTAATSAAPFLTRKLTLVISLGIAIPAIAFGLYFSLGSPEAMKPQQAQAPADGNHSLTPDQIQAMVGRLAEKLQNNPNDGDGWLMLGRSYTVLGRYAEASAAYGRAAGLVMPDPNLLADYADVLAMAQGRRLAGEPEKIIERALTLDPKHIKSLALSGSAAFERGDFGRAALQWTTILGLVPQDSPAAQNIRNSIADAERRMGKTPSSMAMPAQALMPAQSTKAPSANTAGTAAGSVGGRVSISPALAKQIPSGSTLFIFARPVDGSRIPLAMTKLSGVSFPYQFSLDDSMSMMPNLKLSTADKVIIGARLSISGDAGAKPGDMEGFSSPVAVGKTGIEIVIDTVVK